MIGHIAIVVMNLWCINMLKEAEPSGLRNVAIGLNTLSGVINTFVIVNFLSAGF